MEVELLVAEIGSEKNADRLFHVMYDGTVLDEHNFSVLGGDSQAVADRLKSVYVVNASLKVALQNAIAALSGTETKLEYADLEIAVLERNGRRRCFRRIADSEIESIIT
jgi:proteasome alpha subunit